GNDGVGSLVKQSEGTIGYVELAEVIQAKLQQAYIKNRAGSFLQATLEGASQAAAANPSISPENFSITDQSGAGAYPLATFSWVVLRQEQKDAAREKALVELWRWMVTTGQSYGTDLQYAPLPKSAADYALDQLQKVKT
ncbi:MAG: phosphate ABC transporter substrate-binding protein PstS, partial [Candidatus Dormibacteraceae bacterium]